MLQQNAMRLARTEMNIAYRTADYDRQQDLDFVVGIEVHLSGNHTCKGVKGEFHDICDELQGRYPKDFKFTGWHPNCRCYTTTILKTPEEFKADEERIMRGEEPTEESRNQVTDVPNNFKRWLEENEERIANARRLPYFLRDNGVRTNGEYELKTFNQPESVVLTTLISSNLSERIKEYERYIKDKEYKDVEIDRYTGGLKATSVKHKEHKNDKAKYFLDKLTGDELEKEFQEEAFKRGHSVVFLAESDTEVALDMLLDGELMDLVSVTNNSKNFKCQLGRKDKQLRSYNKLHNQENNSVCMWFHEPSYYDISKVYDGIRLLKEYQGNTQIKRVYVLIKGGKEIIVIDI